MQLQGLIISQKTDLPAASRGQRLQSISRERKFTKTVETMINDVMQNSIIEKEKSINERNEDQKG